MKVFALKYLVFVLFAYTFIGTLRANDYTDAYDQNCCRSYECSCNPLYCGAFDIEFQGGVAPILWRNRGGIAAVNCSVVVPTPGFIPLFDIPKFNTFFKIPWTVGGQVGYALSDNARVYLEFNYAQARAKSDSAILTTNPALIPAQTLTFNFTKYKLFDGYVGARYYCDRWCDKISLFFGGKIGFTHHKQVDFGLTVTTPPAATITLFPAGTAFFASHTVVSGGGNFGLDICFCGNWSLVITGEIVASCGPHAIGNLEVPTPPVGAATSIVVGHIDTELRFPVTAGVRYSF